MYRDLGFITLHINRYYLSNFAFGFDFYQIYDHATEQYQASVLQFNLLFFNVTFTKWAKWTSKNY